MLRRRRLLEICEESPASSARFVGRVNVSGKLLARPHSARERNIDLSLARSRLLNKPDDVTVGASYTCDQSSAHRFLHERADPCLFGGSQFLQREGGRPHGAFVEVRRAALLYVVLHFEPPWMLCMMPNTRLTWSRFSRRSGAAAGYVPNSFLIRFLSMNLRLMYVPTPHELFLFHYECCSHSDMCFSQNFTAYSGHPSASVPMPSPKP